MLHEVIPRSLELFLLLTTGLQYFPIFSLRADLWAGRPHGQAPVISYHGISSTTFGEL